MAKQELDNFTRNYIIAALWSDHGDTCEFLDNKYKIDDINAETQAEMIADCKRFQEEQAVQLQQIPLYTGFDFFLSRNGHGGPSCFGDILQDAARAFGEWHLAEYGDGTIGKM